MAHASPVVELFGPTIQGEGVHQGTPAYFVRFGGCDYRCVWCDTPHAVLPDLVRKNSTKCTASEIVQKVKDLVPGPEWVVLTGGNPVLHDLEDLVHELKESLYYTSVETQGTVWKDWVAMCDSVCVSPKPPSSGMNPVQTSEALHEFMGKIVRRGGVGVTFFKVVVFDQVDYYWARDLHLNYPEIPLYLSAGNDAGATVDAPGRVDERSLTRVREDLIEKFRWLTNWAMVDPAMADAKVQAQAHVLLWGNERGH